VRKVSKRPVKARRKWPRNPKTQVVESGAIYSRPREKEDLKRIYGPRTFLEEDA
jgi:hypothetical protein